MALSQLAFRARNDDGSETLASWIAALNTNWTQDVDVNFRIRFDIEETGDQGEKDGFQLQYNLNSAGWNDVNGTSAVVRSSASTHYADEDDTTQQIGSGAFVSPNAGMDENNGFANEAGGELRLDGAEAEFCVQILSGGVVDADSLQLRLVRAGGQGVFNTYTNTPTITVNEVAAGQTATPSPVVVASSIPAPSIIAGGVTLTPTPVASAWSIPAPTVTNVSPGQTATPDPVASAWSIPAPTIIAGGVTLTPDPVASTWSIPTPTLIAGGVTLTPDPVVTSWSIPTPTVTSVSPGQTATPDPVASTWSIPAPTVVSGGVTVLIDPVVSGWVIPVPIVTNALPGQTATPDPVVVAWSIPAPFLLVGGITAGPSPVVASLSIPAPVVSIAGATSTPSDLNYLTFSIGGGLNKTFLPSGNTAPMVVEANAPSGAPASGKGVIYQTSGGVVTVHVWDGTQWLARVL